ncbi:unnamed protein product, partial [marine sediment metagenome]
MSRKAILLLSGGIDSATTLFLAKKRGFKPLALIFDYGQRHKKEIKYAKRLAKFAHCPYKVLKLSLPKKGSSLTCVSEKIPSGRSLKQINRGIPSTYVPSRNLIFLSLALSYAESEKAKAIFIGAHTEDFSGYPDCRKTFFNEFKKVIKCGTKHGSSIKVYTPLIAKNKKEIVKTGLRLGVPFELTWSCYKGGDVPCGV